MDPLTAWAITIWFAACVLALVCLVRKVREWDAIAEERRRRDDAGAFRAQLAAMTEAETKRWLDWATAQGYGPAVLWGPAASETPVYDATVRHIAAQSAASIDDEWEALCRATGGDAA